MAQVSPSFSLTEYRTRIRARFSTLGSRIEPALRGRWLLPSLVPRRGRQRHQEGVHPGVVGELRVERAEHDPALPDCHRMIVDAGQDLDAVAVAGYARRADEDCAQWIGTEPVDLKLDLEARDLPTEGVSLGGRVDEAQVVAVADDHAGAGPENRAPRLGVGANRGLEAVALDRLRDGRALAARDHQAVEPVNFRRRAHLDGVRSEGPKHLGVGGEVPLAGQRTNSEPGPLRGLRRHGTRVIHAVP